jgi:4-hydroxy-tetrahydrodipicolinate reductase
MGREVEALALAKGHEIMFRLNSEHDWEAAGDKLTVGDVIIDFSWPASAPGNIRRAFDMGIPVVTGTTGWYEQLPNIRIWCEKEDRTLLVAPNFSIGVNIMLRLSETLSRLMNRFREYDLSIEEIHHVHKLDSPSGTAIRLAETVIDQIEYFKSWSDTRDNEKSSLYVASRREGEVTGTHILKAESDHDTLEIVHHAKDRKGFAAGAILAAEWIRGKQGFFTMKDLLEFTD